MHPGFPAELNQAALSVTELIAVHVAVHQGIDISEESRKRIRNASQLFVRVACRDVGLRQVFASRAEFIQRECDLDSPFHRYLDQSLELLTDSKVSFIYCEQWNAMSEFDRKKLSADAKNSKELFGDNGFGFLTDIRRCYANGVVYYQQLYEIKRLFESIKGTIETRARRLESLKERREWPSERIEESEESITRFLNVVDTIKRKAEKLEALGFERRNRPLPPHKVVGHCDGCRILWQLLPESSHQKSTIAMLDSELGSAWYHAIQRAVISLREWNDAQRLVSPSGNVELFDEGMPPIVNRAFKPPLKRSGYRVVKALIQMAGEGLSESQLAKMSGCSDAKAIVGRLKRDPDWNKTVLRPSESGGGFQVP